MYSTRLDTQEEALGENHASFTLSEDQALRRSYGQNSLVPTVGKESNRSDEVLADDGRAATAFFSGGSVLRHYGRVDKAKIASWSWNLDVIEQQLHDVGWNSLQQLQSGIATSACSHNDPRWFDDLISAPTGWVGAQPKAVHGSTFRLASSSFSAAMAECLTGFGCVQFN